jgi:hypothetical protein
LCVVDARLRFDTDPLGFCCVCSHGLGQPAVASPGPERFQLRRHRFGLLIGLGAQLVGGDCPPHGLDRPDSAAPAR